MASGVGRCSSTQRLGETRPTTQAATARSALALPTSTPSWGDVGNDLDSLDEVMVLKANEVDEQDEEGGSPQHGPPATTFMSAVTRE